MEKRTNIDRIHIKTRNEIRALRDKLTVEESLKFISTNLKIAPACVELILTTLGYIIRLDNRICQTERMLKLTKYDQDTCTDKLTASGLELLYRLVFNSVYRIKPRHIMHPVIFDEYTQPLAESDDKNLIQIDIALDKIYTKLCQKYYPYCINADTNTYHDILEKAGKFKFNEDGTVAKCIDDIDHYTYYIYNAENADKFNVINDLSINSKEIYISKETYSKLADMIDDILKSRINNAKVFKTTDEGRCKTNKDEFQEIKKSDKDISLNLFISLVTGTFEKCYESDVTKVLLRQKIIKIDDNNKIYINEPNKFLYANRDGDILVKIEKMFELFIIVTSDINFFHNVINSARNIIDPREEYNKIFNGPNNYSCGRSK